MSWAHRALNDFKTLRILVLGDSILDAYVHGQVSRLSPEAPVPVLDISHREQRLGGAANVALNLHSLGAEAVLLTAVGNDSGGSHLRQLLTENGLSTEGLLVDDNRQTSVKTRYVAGGHQLLRSDEEQRDDLSATAAEELLRTLERLLKEKKCDALVFQDYDKGVLNGATISAAMALCAAHGVPTAADPKKKNFLAYAGVSLFKPNLRELRDGLDLPLADTSTESLLNAFGTLNRAMPVGAALFTLSSEGVFVAHGSEWSRYPAYATHISDVSGAGDTVIAVAACCLALRLPMNQLAWLSNLAGSVVCRYPGVVPITVTLLAEELKKHKV